MNRRDFVKATAATAAVSTLAASNSFATGSSADQKIKVGFIGVGARGSGQLGVMLQRKDVIVTAICDVDTAAVDKAVDMVKKAGMPTPARYEKGNYAYRDMLASANVDAVIISTPWEWHTPMAIDAMKAKKAVGLEVAGAFSINECWQLVETYEATRTPFMILENVNYRRDVMAVLNMVRQGLFGELIHLQGGYQHDLRAVKFNNGKQYYGGGVEFGDKAYSEARWRTTHSVYRNGDLYPTHGIGPIGAYINNNRGNRFVHLTSMASKARGLHEYVVANGGASHPNAKVDFKLGDVVTTMIQCYNGETILLQHDTNLPRPYSLGFRVQGTKGLWMDVNNSLHIEGTSKAHSWEKADEYLKKYDHPLWAKYETLTKEAGHGGMDFFVLHAFIEALKQGKDMPLDVYDHVSWAAITCLSEDSIAQGGKPMLFPDFTNGQWMHRKPIFALDDNF